MSDKQIRQKDCFTFSIFSTTRDRLFGIATLMVIIFHSYISFSALLPDAQWLATTLDVLRRSCVVGVDVFLFMSGIGLYYSLSGKNKSLKEFYKKRATRILPALLVVSFIWFGIRGAATADAFLQNVFLVSFYTKGTRYFWYFALIIVLYIIYPLLHLLLEKTGVIGAIVTIGLVIGATAILKSANPQLYAYIEIALTRIPVFIIGAWLGKFVKNGTKLPSWIVNLAVVFIIPLIILCFHYVPQWRQQFPEHNMSLLWLHRGLGNILGLCLVFAWAAIFSKIKSGAFGTFLIWIGSMSMELYLVHEKIGIYFSGKIKTGDPSSLLYYTTTFIIALLFAMALKAMENSLDKNLFYKSKQKQLN